MENLATELLVDIFELACAADDGSIARSLSLVSRRISEASRPFRFRAVSLHATTTNLRRLIHRIQAERLQCDSIQPRCRHIFLDCPQVEPKELDDSLTPEDSLTVPCGERFPSSPFGPDCRRRANVWKVWSYLVSSLLCAIAPDLETLTFATYPDFLEPITLPCPFPALRELTMVSYDSRLSLHATATDPCIFPSLRRLHLVSLSEEFSADIAFLAKHTPNLTHLRISNITRQSNLGALFNLYSQSLLLVYVRDPGSH